MKQAGGGSLAADSCVSGTPLCLKRRLFSMRSCRGKGMSWKVMLLPFAAQAADVTIDCALCLKSEDARQYRAAGSPSSACGCRILQGNSVQEGGLPAGHVCLCLQLCPAAAQAPNYLPLPVTVRLRGGPEHIMHI